MNDNFFGQGTDQKDDEPKGTAGILTAGAELAESAAAEAAEKGADAVNEAGEKSGSSVNDPITGGEPAAMTATEENVAGDSSVTKKEEEEKDPFKRIDFGKPLYQAAPAPAAEAPKALGPSPSAGSTGTEQSGPSQPAGSGAVSGPSQSAGSGAMNGPSQPAGAAAIDGASLPKGAVPVNGVSQPAGAMSMGGPVQPGAPMQPGGMAPMGGPSPFGGAGPQFGGMMPNGDPMFSPYGGQAPQYGGAVPQPVEPVQTGGAYAQGGPGFGPGMGYQQIPPYQQPMGDMYYGYQDPYMSMMQANNQGMGLGIASMVLGILALVTCCCWYISGPLSAISLILGIIGIKSDNGKGMAIAGVVCSGVALLILGCIMVYSCSVYGSAFNSFRNLMNIP